MSLVPNLRSLPVLTAFTLILFSCSEQDKRSIENSASAFDIKQAEASITQGNQNLIKSFKARDSVGVASIFATDAKAMAPNMPSIVGRRNITHYIAQTIKKGYTDFYLTTTKIWGDSSIVAEEGTYNVADTSGKQVDKGKYIVLWKTEAGNWKIFRDIWASDLPDTLAAGKTQSLQKK